MPERKVVDELKIVEMAAAGSLRMEICEEMSLREEIVDRVCQKYDQFVQKGRRSKTEGKHPQIVQMYRDGMGMQEIGDRFDVSIPTIKKVLVDDGTVVFRSQSEAVQKYPLDQNYFKVIDTEQKAYIFGFICGDGYNYRPTNSVSIRICDEDLLKDIRDVISPTRPLFTIVDRDREKDKYLLTISNKRISQDLADLGCDQGKSLTISFPTPNQVPNSLVHHYVRGIFDADGCVSFVRNMGRIAAEFIAPRQFCEDAAKVIPVPSFIRDRRSCAMSDLRISKQIDLIRFRNWMYRDATLYLKRKHRKFYSVEIDPTQPHKVCRVGENGELISRPSARLGQLAHPDAKKNMSAAWANRSGIVWDGVPISMIDACKKLGKCQKTIKDWMDKKDKSAQEIIDYFRSIC